MVIRASSVLATLLAVSGCEKPASLAGKEIDHELVEIVAEHINLRHDEVGAGQWKKKASFVLVEAHNTFSKDLAITLDGALLTEAGEKVGVLRPESLRVPAHGRRIFALVDNENQWRKTASQVSVGVVGAMILGYEPVIKIEQEHVYQDGNRVVVGANLINPHARRVKAIIFAAFADRNGVPMKRPFTEMIIAGRGSHTAQFVGPEGSTSAYIYYGQTVY